MQIAIVGPGALGRLLAWTVLQAGHQPFLLCRREEQAVPFKQDGLLFTNLQATQTRHDVEASSDPTLLDAVDGLIVTVKSYDTSTVAGLLRSVRAPVLSIQNGLGNAEALLERVPADQLTVGVTTYGATADGPTGVLWKGRGRTLLGQWASDAPDRGAAFWHDLLGAGGHEVEVSPAIRSEVWRKAMINIGINPFTALLRVPNGELLQQASLLSTIRETVEEAEAVARAEGIPLQNSFERVLEVCRLTAANKSSMLQDVLAGRKTEIDALCGTIVASGAKHRIATPRNALLSSLVSSLGQE